MNCYCQEGDEAAVSVEAWRTAKKPHRCCECGETIKPGERYQQVRGLWDGAWITFKTCAECVDTRQQVYHLADFVPAYGSAACCFVEAMREASR